MEIIGQIAFGLIVPALLGLVKLYSDHQVIKAKHEGLQAEMNEHKKDVKADINSLKLEQKTELAGTKLELKTDHRDLIKRIDEKFESMEKLIEKLFTFDRERIQEKKDL